MDMNKLSSMELDVLKEIGNIGAGNAATSMSTLIDQRIHMDVPTVEVVTFNEMMDMVGGPDELIVGMFFRVYGEAPSTVYFILSLAEAESLIQKITNDEDFKLASGIEYDDIAFSALKEFSNIMTGSYLTALSEFTNISMKPTVPHLCIDMAGAILTAGLIELSQVSDHAIVINTDMTDGLSKKGIGGKFFLLPDPETIPVLFKALGIGEYD